MEDVAAGRLDDDSARNKRLGSDRRNDGREERGEEREKRRWGVICPSEQGSTQMTQPNAPPPENDTFEEENDTDDTNSNDM